LSPSTPRLVRALSLAALAHAGAMAVLGRLRPEHVLADGLIAILPWIGPGAAALAFLALPVWLAGLLMDSQPFFIGLRGAIHTGDLRNLERALFPAGRISWSEWLSSRPTPTLDLLTGFAYGTYLLEYFAVTLVLMRRARRTSLELAWAFLAANVVGVLIYMLVPAAPPWYVAQHGPGPADLHALPSAAGAARVDALLGIHYFASFYSRNPNIFGAMPSLHAAYPLLVALLTWQRGPRWRVLTLAYAGLMAFSAVYLQHHYLLDVIGGWLVAGVVAAGVGACSARMPPHQRQRT
jgi:inositol phosphorylceramide synthase catalytic subunit